MKTSWMDSLARRSRELY